MAGVSGRIFIISWAGISPAYEAWWCRELPNQIVLGPP